MDRPSGQTGACQTGILARVASAGAHFGEEPALVGSGGSGTIFFRGCNLCCEYCQNFDISRSARGGTEVSVEDLAGLMARLELQG